MGSTKPPRADQLLDLGPRTPQSGGIHRPTQGPRLPSRQSLGGGGGRRRHCAPARGRRCRRQCGGPWQRRSIQQLAHPFARRQRQAPIRTQPAHRRPQLPPRQHGIHGPVCPTATAAAATSSALGPPPAAHYACLPGELLASWRQRRQGLPYLDAHRCGGRVAILTPLVYQAFAGSGAGDEVGRRPGWPTAPRTRQRGRLRLRRGSGLRSFWAAAATPSSPRCCGRTAGSGALGLVYDWRRSSPRQRFVGTGVGRAASSSASVSSISRSQSRSRRRRCRRGGVRRGCFTGGE